MVKLILWSWRPKARQMSYEVFDPSILMYIYYGICNKPTPLYLACEQGYINLNNYRNMFFILIWSSGIVYPPLYNLFRRINIAYFYLAITMDGILRVVETQRYSGIPYLIKPKEALKWSRWPLCGYIARFSLIARLASMGYDHILQEGYRIR